MAILTTEVKPASNEKQQEEKQPEIPEDGLCIVLYGYGRVAPTYRCFVDEYQFVGGVGRNIPYQVAKHWKKGTRADGKPPLSRVKIQAILPEDATEADFAKATGVSPMAPEKLAAMIGVTDAALLVKAMGRKRAIELAEELLKNSGAS